MARTARAALALLLSVVGLAAAGGPAAAGGGGGCPGEFADEATNEIKVAMNCYLPTVARVDVGDTVTWFSWKHELPHTVTPVSEAFRVGNEDLPPGGRQSATFDEPGVFPYACLLHPGMVGAIVVGDAGVSGAPASAPIDAAPPATTAAVQPAASGAPMVIVGAAALAVVAGLVVALRRTRRALPAPSVGPTPMT